jgi:hypothetical protein
MDKRDQARETLERLGVPVGGDFHALPLAKRDLLEEEADRVRYRRPRNANASRLRYFHDRLQRRARA